MRINKENLNNKRIFETINIPSNVQISFEKSNIIIQGPLGKLAIEKDTSISLPNEISTEGIGINIEYSKVTNKIQNNNLIISYYMNEDKKIWGTFKSLIRNNIIGVTEGFEKKLKIEGIGYKATQIKEEIIFNLGYSHEISYKIPEDIQIKIINPNLLEIKGISKQRVGQIAAEIKNLRKPSLYRIKGIYDNNAVIKIKTTQKK